MRGTEVRDNHLNKTKSYSACSDFRNVEIINASSKVVNIAPPHDHADLTPSLLGNETNLDAAFHGGEYTIEHRQRLSLEKPRLLAGRQLTPSDACNASQLKISHDVRFIQIKHCKARIEFHWLDSIEFYSVGRDQFQAISSPS